MDGMPWIVTIARTLKKQHGRGFLLLIYQSIMNF